MLIVSLSVHNVNVKADKKNRNLGGFPQSKLLNVTNMPCLFQQARITDNLVFSSREIQWQHVLCSMLVVKLSLYTIGKAISCLTGCRR